MIGEKIVTHGPSPHMISTFGDYNMIDDSANPNKKKELGNCDSDSVFPKTDWCKGDPVKSCLGCNRVRRYTAAQGTGHTANPGSRSQTETKKTTQHFINTSLKNLRTLSIY